MNLKRQLKWYDGIHAVCYDLLPHLTLLGVIADRFQLEPFNGIISIAPFTVADPRNDYNAGDIPRSFFFTFIIYLWVSLWRGGGTKIDFSSLVVKDLLSREKRYHRKQTQEKR